MIVNEPAVYSSFEASKKEQGSYWHSMETSSRTSRKKNYGNGSIAQGAKARKLAANFSWETAWKLQEDGHKRDARASYSEKLRILNELMRRHSFLVRAGQIVQRSQD